MVTSLLLLAFLFLAGFFNVYFYFSRKKFHAWLQSFFPDNTPKVMIPVKEKSDSDSNKAELKRVFATFDKNGDGFITKQELRDSLKNIRLFTTEKEVEDMVVRADANGDGLIDFDEFCILCGGEDELKEAFDVFDKDKDGLISFEELGSVLCSLGLNEGKKMEDCKAMIRKVDMDGDGMVNFDEFKKMLKNGAGFVPVC
ncbi:calmodulin-like protein 3 [Hibiscus syriacus]|uniref:calmodulin-like protein 3 n=1 Tax=Hibiscus syriacus TaxID=106335 RepID=UPI001924E3A1|nr:calmodulin-like protein 3 [Hibiscus syriacus]XP_039018861.1 calmodulin-like protein 3 [Hibiscus syriacus]